MLFGCSEPSVPVVGMSNSYLFSIEYFDFVSRLEEMHKLDPSVPVFRPEKTYDDLLKEVEEEKEKEENGVNSTDESQNVLQTEDGTNNNYSNVMEEDENKDTEKLEEETLPEINKTEKKDFEMDDLKKGYLSSDKDHNNLELEENNELKTREE